MRRLPICLALAIGASLLAAPAGAQVSVRPGDAIEPLVASNPTLRARLTRIANRSALWREAIAALRDRGRQAITDACSIRRENAVRAELGLGRRTTYGLDDLNLARRTRR